MLLTPRDAPDATSPLADDVIDRGDFGVSVALPAMRMVPARGALYCEFSPCPLFPRREQTYKQVLISLQRPFV